MRRVLVLLVALGFLPALCRAQVDVTNYQIDVTGDWVETNPSCVSNCTETISMDFLYEKNLDYNPSNPTSPTSTTAGWINMSAFQTDSSGFLGKFSFLPSYYPPSGLWAIDGTTASDLPVWNSTNPYTADEIDLHDLTFFAPVPPSLLIYNCYSNACLNAFQPPYQEIVANTTETRIVAVPEPDPAWQFLLFGAIACGTGLLVKHRLGLLRADLCASKT